jgi:hypothetical protein
VRKALAIGAAALAGCAPLETTTKLSDIYPPVDGVPVLGRHFAVSGRKDAAFDVEFKVSYYSTSQERKCRTYIPFPVSTWTGREMEETFRTVAAGDGYRARLPLDLVRDDCVYRAASLNVVTRSANRTYTNQLVFSQNNAGHPGPLSITFLCGNPLPVARGSSCALADDQGNVNPTLTLGITLGRALERATINIHPRLPE